MITKVVFTVGAVLRGDDVAGPMFAKMLEQNPIPGWTYIDGGQTPEDDLAVIRRMQPDMLLLVDAAQMGREPGTIAVVDERDVVSDLLITTRPLPITFLLEDLKKSCKQVVFLGIQPAQLEFMEPLTPEVLKSVERIYEFLKQGADFSHLPV